jgi:hypothetical protein
MKYYDSGSDFYTQEGTMPPRAICEAWFVKDSLLDPIEPFSNFVHSNKEKIVTGLGSIPVNIKRTSYRNFIIVPEGGATAEVQVKDWGFFLFVINAGNGTFPLPKKQGKKLFVRPGDIVHLH